MHLYLPLPNWGEEPVSEYVPAGRCSVNIPVAGAKAVNV